MIAVTEFPAFTLSKANQVVASLTAEGKTPDEIKENLGQSFKLEGDKLGYFMQALEVATNNSKDLKRVMVLRLNEGEKAPAKAVQVEQICFVPDFLVQVRAAEPADQGKGRRQGGRGKGNSGPKGSPWGLSPEEKAMKNKKPAPTT